MQVRHDLPTIMKVFHHGIYHQADVDADAAVERSLEQSLRLFAGFTARVASLASIWVTGMSCSFVTRRQSYARRFWTQRHGRLSIACLLVLLRRRSSVRHTRVVTFAAWRPSHLSCGSMKVYHQSTRPKPPHAACSCNQCAVAADAEFRRLIGLAVKMSIWEPMLAFYSGRIPNGSKQFQTVPD
jgi:hypothetical protein